MLGNSMRWSGLLICAAIFALIANAALYFRMSAKLEAIEASITAHGSPAQAASVAIDGTAAAYPAAAVSALPSHSAAAKLSPEELVQRLSQRNSSDPAKITAGLNQLMQQEPAMPAVESQQTQWLESAFGNLPAGGPRPSNAQSSCRGRRCIVSATFTDAGEAQDWAGSYLLAAGGKLLQRSRTIVVPAANGSVKLLLYFY